MNSQTETKPKGSALTAIGVGIAIFGVVFVVLAVATGGAPTIYTVGMVIIGLILAAVGFGQRVLAALEKRSVP